MDILGSTQIDISVILGTKTMPVHQLLRMGRGAVIGLDTKEDDDVKVLANNVAIAEGRIMLQDGAIAVSITRVLERPGAARTKRPSDPV